VPVPVAARSKAEACGDSLAESEGSNLTCMQQNLKIKLVLSRLSVYKADSQCVHTDNVLHIQALQSTIIVITTEGQMLSQILPSRFF